MGHNFPSKPLVVIVSPLLSIMEDQVKWLRSRGFAAANIGESNDKDRSIIHGQGNFNFVYGSPEPIVLTSEKIVVMISKSITRVL